MERKRCEICGAALPNMARALLCDLHLRMVRREKAKERAGKRRDAIRLQRAFDVLSAPLDERQVGQPLRSIRTKESN